MAAKGERVDTGWIQTIKIRCPKCFHHKAWDKNSGRFCTRCRYQHER